MSELKSFKTSKWQIKLKYDEDFQVLMWKAKNGRIPVSTVEPINPIIEKINTNKDRWELYCMPKEYEYLIYHLNSIAKAEHEATELTYDKVAEELKGLEGFDYIKKLEDYEYNVGIPDYVNKTLIFKKLNWSSIRIGQISTTYLKDGCERGLIKLRRVK